MSVDTVDARGHFEAISRQARVIASATEVGELVVVFDGLPERDP